MKVAPAQDEDDADADYRADPCCPRKACEQAEKEYDDQVGREDSGGDRTPADELREGQREQHGEEDAQEVGIGQRDVRPDDVICGGEVAATEKPEGRLKDSD